MAKDQKEELHEELVRAKTDRTALRAALRRIATALEMGPDEATATTVAERVEAMVRARKRKAEEAEAQENRQERKETKTERACLAYEALAASKAAFVRRLVDLPSECGFQKLDVFCHDGNKYAVVGYHRERPSFAVQCVPTKLLLDPDVGVAHTFAKITSFGFRLDFIANKIGTPERLSALRIGRFWDWFGGTPRTLMFRGEPIRVLDVLPGGFRQPIVLQSTTSGQRVRCMWDKAAFAEVR